MTLNTTRRGFLKSAAATGFVLTIGVRADGALAASGDAAMLNPFVKFDATGKVFVVVKNFEMGQGPSTGMATIIADEIGLNMDQIGYEFAPSNPEIYGNGAFQGTGGSSSMRTSFDKYRQAGAAAREMILQAAGDAWGVAPSDLKIISGEVTGAGKTAPIADFLKAAAKIAAPEDPRLKSPSEWTLIGNSDVRRVDSPSKINGQAKFGMDLHLDNQMVVAVARPEALGGVVTGYNASEAEAVKGFIMAKALPNNKGIAVYAETTWAAMQAREALNVDWDMSAAETRSSDQIKQEIMDALAAEEATYNVTKNDVSEVRGHVNGAAQVVEETFYFPLLAHAPMEPVNCTIEADGNGGVILHDGCQMPTGAHGALAATLKLPMEKIQIKTLLAGGSFGRRATPDADYQTEAAMAFAMTDKSRPVKLVWTREDDIRTGYYRPAFGHKVRIGLDEAGAITGWEHRVAGQSIIKGTPFETMVVKEGIDHTSVEGIGNSPYKIPNMHVGLTDVSKATTTLWWRSVGHTHTAYAMEVMMDRAALAAGKDPVAFRLDYLQGTNKDQTRKANVLKLVAEKAGWGTAKPGIAQGVAVHKSFQTYVAEVVEISGSADDGYKIEKVYAAVDCGIAVNPDVIKAQVEGAIGYGIGHAMRDQITLTNGVPDQHNFPDYEPLRIGDIGDIETHIIASTEAPTGIGEPGTPPSAPALANAIHRSNQELRVAFLPMTEHGVGFA